MVFLWSWLAHANPPGADAPADPAAVRAFLDWHCSENNVPRYDGALTLAEAPEGVVGAGSRSPFSVEIGPEGIVRHPPREVLQNNPTVAIAADAPAPAVAGAFRWIVRQLSDDADVGVLMARPGAFAPRPDPPRKEAVLERIGKVEVQRQRDPQSDVQISSRLYLAAGRCREVADEAWQSCEAGAARIVAALADPQCGVDETELIAMFAAHWGKGTEGQPIVRVPIRVVGPERFEGSGTWAEAAPSFLAQAEPALVSSRSEAGLVGGVVGGVRAGSGPREGIRVFHHSELKVKKRVRVPYPEEALAMKLGTQRCMARVFIGSNGVPEEVVVDKCPRVFHAPVRERVLRWRWRPPTDGVKRIAAQTAIAITLDPP